MKSFLSLACLLLFTSVTEARQSARPVTMEAGAPLAGSERIVAGTEQFLLYTLSDSLRLPHSLLTRTVESDRTVGREIIRVIQRYDGSDGVSIDTSTAVKATLLPISYASWLPGESQRFTFGSDKVEGVISAPGEPAQTVEFSLDTPVYNAVILEELVKAVPLSEGAVLDFHTYNPGRNTLSNTLRVVGTESISLANGATADTWVLSFEGGPLPTTAWVSQGSQQLIRMRTDLPNGTEFWKVRLYPVAERQMDR
jgi:hypothetical protein